MTGRYLLDTNTASCVINGNFPRVRERLLKVPNGAACDLGGYRSGDAVWRRSQAGSECRFKNFKCGFDLPSPRRKLSGTLGRSC